MIIYNPLDGLALSHSIVGKPRQIFLMTRLGNPVPNMVGEIRQAIEECCPDFEYGVIDAQAKVTGRDFLLKIWKLIVSTPLAVGVLHEDIPADTQANIFYEIGVAQALGKETVIIKSPGAKIPSDFVRSEYVTFDENFRMNFCAFLESADEQADYYETMGDQLERNPLLAIDYYKRAYLIKGDDSLKNKAISVLGSAGLEQRATNSVELLAASF